MTTRIPIVVIYTQVLLACLYYLENPTEGNVPFL